MKQPSDRRLAVAARASALERMAHCARETFDRLADRRAGLSSLDRPRDRSTQRSLALDACEQFRLVLFKSLETVSDLADLCLYCRAREQHTSLDSTRPCDLEKGCACALGHARRLSHRLPLATGWKEVAG